MCWFFIQYRPSLFRFCPFITSKLKFWAFPFSILREESAALAHHLPAGFAGSCDLCSAMPMGCWLVMEQASSITAKYFELLLHAALFG